tara:strand:- start:3164 stop:3607 length:444 start_codon:yes stop_codon:yes gene_type:complete
MQYFEPSEFREWYTQMSPRLLTLLDVLRFTIGKSIIISPDKDALGRHLGPTEMSCHNVDVHGEVLAVDFFCPWINGEDQVRHIFNTMRGLGFTGIGVYADTHYGGKPCPMFHGDVRPTEKMGSPATWGRVNGKYVSINEAIGSCTFS